MKRLMLVFSIAVLLVLAPVSASATDSNQANVNLQALVQEDISVSVGVANVNFTIVAAGPADGSVPIPIETSWNLPAGPLGLRLYAYFDDPAMALQNAALAFTNIPSSEVYGKLNAGPFNPYTDGGAFGGPGASLTLFTEIFVVAPFQGTRNDTLSLRIDPVVQHPTGLYVGTLHIQATTL